MCGSESSIGLTVKSCIIASHMCGMFRELNHVLVDMLVVLHFEFTDCMFRGLGQISLPKESI